MSQSSTKGPAQLDEESETDLTQTSITGPSQRISQASSTKLQKRKSRIRKVTAFENKSDQGLEKKKSKHVAVIPTTDSSHGGKVTSPVASTVISPASPATPVSAAASGVSIETTRKSNQSNFLDFLESERDEYFDETTFEMFESTILPSLKEIETSPSCSSYYPDVEKLYMALRKYFDEGRQLLEKFEEVRTENEVNKERIADAFRIQEDDQAMIASLRKELDRAWKQYEDGQEKEQQQKELIHTLETELDHVQRMFEQVPVLAAGPEAVLELQRHRDDLLKEKDQLGGELYKLREQVNVLTGGLQQAEKDKEQLEETIKELTQENYKRRGELQREGRRREKLELDIKQNKVELDGKMDQVLNLQQVIAKQKDNANALEHKLKDLKIQKDQLNKEMEVTNMRVMRLQQDVEMQQQASEQYNKENSQLASEIRAKDDELTQYRTQNAKLNKLRDMLTRKINNLDEQRIELEQSREDLKGEMLTLQREMEVIKKHAEQDKKTIEESVRERENMTKNLLKANVSIQKQGASMKYVEQAKRALELELLNSRNEMDKLHSNILMMEREKDRLVSQNSDMTKKLMTMTSEMKVKDLQMFDTKKKLLDTESKLKQQVNLYEAVRSDRNLFNKNLIETQDEVTEMKRKLKIMTHQIEQLKDEVNAKDSTLIRERLASQKVEREKETIKTELMQFKEQSQTMKLNLDAALGEHRRMGKMLQDAEKDMNKKDKEMSLIRNERDILGAQLVRRNDEVVLLLQKIQIHQVVLRRGEQEYRKRIDDIRLLKLEIQKLRREKIILTKSARKVDELQRELYHMQRELLRERTRCKALEEEMENPVNIHRWRKLQGNDPSTYELIQKTHVLQRRLIARTELVVEKEVLIQEKEQLYTELKNILARQPRPEMARELLVYRKTLRDKTRQLKGMAAELNMYECQMDENKAEVERLVEELKEYKTKYYELKKKEQERLPSIPQLKRAESPTQQTESTALRKGKVIINGNVKQSPRNRFTITGI